MITYLIVQNLDTDRFEVYAEIGETSYYMSEFYSEDDAEEFVTEIELEA